MFPIKEIVKELSEFYGSILYKTLSMSFVLYKFYQWFVTPFLGGHSPILHYKIFLGISLIITLIIGAQDSAFETVDGKDIEKKTNWVALILFPWLIFSTGWVIQLFI